MPAKLTEKQTSALRIANKLSWIDTSAAHPAVLLSLEKRGFLYRGKLSIRTFEITQSGRDAITEIDAEIQATPTPTLDLVFPPEPLPKAGPLKTTFNLPKADFLDIEPKRETPTLVSETVWRSCRDEKTIREQYQRAYRAERFTQGEPDSAFDYSIDIDDVPVDIAIAAHESYKASQYINPSPFLVRIWYKRMVDAKEALNRVPLYDNAGFNNAVLDFKIAKARYMSIEERWELRQAAGARR